jgi:hypothetical protein
LFAEANTAYERKDIATAKIRLDELLRLAPKNKRGLELKSQIEGLQRRHAVLFDEAKTLLRKKRDEAAVGRLTVIVAEDLSNQKAKSLLSSITSAKQVESADCQTFGTQIGTALEQKDFIKARYLVKAAQTAKCSQASALDKRVTKEASAVPPWVRENTSFAFDELTRAKTMISNGQTKEGKQIAESVIEIYGSDKSVIQEAQAVLSMAQ